ncbi:MAG: hemin uptake protein HemP [Filomicrobium sp.]
MEGEIEPPDPAAPAAKNVRRIPVLDLFEGSNELILIHNGDDYRLRITSKGRLILTK